MVLTVRATHCSGVWVVGVLCQSAILCLSVLPTVSVYTAVDTDFTSVQTGACWGDGRWAVRDSHGDWNRPFASSRWVTINFHTYIFKLQMCLILCLVRGLKVQLSVWIKGACMEHLSQLLMLQSLWHAGLNGMVLCFEAVRQLGLGLGLHSHGHTSTNSLGETYCHLQFFGSKTLDPCESRPVLTRGTRKFKTHWLRLLWERLLCLHWVERQCSQENMLSAWLCFLSRLYNIFLP